MKSKWQCLLGSVSITIALVLPGSPSVLAQEFYQDKTIRFIAGRLPNMTGAGSLVAANHIVNNALDLA